MIGKKVLVRSNRAGVFFGTLKSETFTPAGKVVVIENCRRVWYWSGAASISQLAQSGTSNPGGCKFPEAVSEIEIVDVIETIPLTDTAICSLENVPVWKI